MESRVQSINWTRQISSSPPPTYQSSCGYNFSKERKVREAFELDQNVVENLCRITDRWHQIVSDSPPSGRKYFRSVYIKIRHIPRTARVTWKVLTILQQEIDVALFCDIISNLQWLLKPIMVLFHFLNLKKSNVALAKRRITHQTKVRRHYCKVTWSRCVWGDNFLIQLFRARRPLAHIFQFKKFFTLIFNKNDLYGLLNCLETKACIRNKLRILLTPDIVSSLWLYESISN